MLSSSSPFNLLLRSLIFISTAWPLMFRLWDPQRSSNTKSQAPNLWSATASQPLADSSNPSSPRRLWILLSIIRIIISLIIIWPTKIMSELAVATSSANPSKSTNQHMTKRSSHTQSTRLRIPNTRKTTQQSHKLMRLILNRCRSKTTNITKWLTLCKSVWNTTRVRSWTTQRKVGHVKSMIRRNGSSYALAARFSL